MTLDNNQLEFRIMIRSDASARIGSGHIMRCLTLSDVLKNRGGRVTFICRQSSDNLKYLIIDRGFKVFELPYIIEPSHKNGIEKRGYASWLDTDWRTDAEQTIEVLKKEGCIDWLIVDHYALNSTWESAIRPYVRRILVIDDLQDCRHNCDLLVNQDAMSAAELAWISKLVPKTSSRLLGLSYAILRPGFREARKSRNGNIRRLFICFGGVDQHNETVKVLQAIQMLERPDICADVVVGSLNPHIEEIRMLMACMVNTSLHMQVEDIANLMSKADAAFIAGGVTMLECCCLGLPALVTVIAENQCRIVRRFADIGAVIYLGKSENLGKEDYVKAIQRLDAAYLHHISEKGLSIIDGYGCNRVVDEMYKINRIRSV